MKDILFQSHPRKRSRDASLLKHIKRSKIHLLPYRIFMHPKGSDSRNIWLYEIRASLDRGKIVIQEIDQGKPGVLYRGQSFKGAETIIQKQIAAMQKRGWEKSTPSEKLRDYFEKASLYSL